MESLCQPHLTCTVKNIYALSFFLLTSGLLLAQKTSCVGTSELRYDNAKKLYLLNSTNVPYTGCAYSTNYYYNNDTILKEYLYNGQVEWSKSYSNKKMTTHAIWYYHGFRNDSICYEYYYFDPYSGDTTMYQVNYVDKNKVKWCKQYTYHLTSVTPNHKKVMSAQYTMRYFTRKETKGFSYYTFQDDNGFDSAGYHTSYAQSGLYAQYYTSGKVQMEGMTCAYEQQMANGGQNAYYYGNSGRCGSWKYYNENGVISREEVYSMNSATVDIIYYNADGRPYSRSNYVKKGSLIKLPSTSGITLSASEDVTVIQTTWHPNGGIATESFRRSNGDVITYGYNENGSPMNITAFSSANKPFGIHKIWDEKGRVVEYTNYSVDYVDTVCYKAVNGIILILNLRDRKVPMNWDGMPPLYYNNEPKAYLYKQVTVYKQFFANGKLKSEVNLKDGVRNGLYKEYDSTGVQVLQLTYKMDIVDGALTEWYPNGKVKRSFSYKDGIRNGNCTEYYATGSVKWENIYVNGVPGKAKAYAENGSLLAASTYLDAFYPATCVETQAKNVRGAALHYYFMDTTMSRNSLIIPDSAVNKYVYKVVAVTNAITPGYDMCEAKSPYASDDEFDIYHSCFVLSKSLYNDTNLAKIKSFFLRNGMQFDKSAPSTNPVLGLEKEYLIYYSSKQMLNKQLIIDSLESFLAPRAIDAKQGYVISVDNNVPEGSIAGAGSNVIMTSSAGYTTIAMESGTRNPVYPMYSTWSTKRYIVYDDLTSDYLSTEYATTPMLYWAGK